jgi:beta-glucosidase
MVTFLEGIISAVNMGTTVQYKPAFLLDRTNPNPIDWATGEAATTDATIVIAGISGLIEGEEGESIASEHFGDRLDYGLPDNQVAYIKKLRSVGKKPLILVLTAGSPVDVSEVEEFADAIIYAWYPGEQGGNALADIIFGDYNPSGRLPITFPKSLDQLPAYEDYSMKGRTYKYMNQDPFYPFGYGLSYTEFDYTDLNSDLQSISKDSELVVSLSIQNSGEKAGEEVVQLYISYPEQLENAPNSTLIDFKRVMIDGGGNAKVEFRLTAAEFMSVDEAGNRVLVPGEYKIHVSGASPMNRSKELGVEILTTGIVVE